MDCIFMGRWSQLSQVLRCIITQEVVPSGSITNIKGWQGKKRQDVKNIAQVFFFQYYYQVRLDGTLLENEENTTPIDFYNVKVYSGSLYNSNPLDGKIRNVRISNIN